MLPSDSIIVEAILKNDLAVLEQAIETCGGSNARLQPSNRVSGMRDFLTSAKVPVKPEDRVLCPLHCAVEYAKPEAVALLLKAGADPSARAWANFTPLHALALCWYENSNCATVAKLLLETGVEVDAPLSSGTSTALALALSHNKPHLATAHVLVAYGANVNLATPRGWTLLHMTSDMGKVEAVAFLLRHGASANATDSFGRTPMSLAAEHGYKEIVELLTKETP